MRSAEQEDEFKRCFPELLELEGVMHQYPGMMDVCVERSLIWQGRTLPIYSLTLGSRDINTPTVLMTAGMHGVERIGSQVLTAWLQSLLERLAWDKNLQSLISQIQLVIMPILNPVGMFLNRRCNGNGIDLNRNAPIDATDKVQLLGSGHRLSSFLPWYRGRKGAVMEEENQALQHVVEQRLFNRPLALALDLHSGFGLQDRLWFPHAYRREPVDNIAQYVALKELWERTYPNHLYVFEPQSIHYLSHGDVWDYFHQLFKQNQEANENSAGNFLSLTLEMGSWAWIKKRPRQLLNFAGFFNPQMKHRHTRVLRQHILLLDFILAAALNGENWLPDNQQSSVLAQTAKGLWFS